MHTRDYKYLDIFYTGNTIHFKVGETYKVPHICILYLATKKHIIRPMTYGTHGRCIHLKFVAGGPSPHDSPRCWAPITSTLLPNAWTCTDPLPGPADLNETRLLGTTPTDGLDIDETIDATKIIRFHTVFMKIQ